jgi:Uma2 family endonuclease
MADSEFRYMTAEELLELSIPDKRVELVRGRLVVREPPGIQHGDVLVQVAVALANYVKAHVLGRVVGGDPGFTLARNPDTVRGPDVAFISSARLPNPLPRAFAEFAPDLAVEVLSPDDRRREVREKVDDYLKAGSRLVWVIDPIRRRATVYRADGTEALLGENDVLLGEDVLPGFECLLASVLL